MRHSLYWDDFERRIDETVCCIKEDKPVPVRRIAVFITEKCNMRCAYCNHHHNRNEMTIDCFDSIVKKYGNGSIIHITGGEPSTVKWLYPYLEENGNEYRFHLNTNCLILPPANSVKRLKVSLDHYDREYWNRLVGINAFDTVVNNIKKCINDTIVSITYTMTKENYKEIPKFIEFTNKHFKGLYALFFSVYKGTNDRFSFNNTDIDCFFDTIKPIMDNMLDDESKNLLNETIQEKFRIMQGERFPENKNSICYISLSERVFSPSGEFSACSHLYRDCIKNNPGIMNDKCLYGCNRRLVAFNEIVKTRLNKDK